jgi:hypothetical protein
MLTETRIEQELDQLRAQRRKEIDDEFGAMKAARQKANQDEKAREVASRKQLTDAGHPVEKMEKETADRSAKAHEEIQKRRKELIEGPSVRRLPDSQLQSPDLFSSALAGTDLYASDPAFLEGIEGDVDIMRATPWAPYEANPWCWARGSGWWGSSDIAVYNDFWFYFYPAANRYYSVVPHSVLHGFYMLYADDAWWNSKNSTVRLDVRVSAYQYNWKPETWYSVINHGGDNINYSSRLDTDRHFYYSFLAGAGDLTWILVTNRLYAYARGDGSYAEINFASGAANYITVPHTHEY